MFRYRAVKKLRKINIKNAEVFTVRDCPVQIGTDSLILVQRPGSHVLLLNTLSRGHPTLDIFEGDYVYDKTTDEQLGVVVYNNGFNVQKNELSFKKLSDLGHIYMRRGDEDSFSLLNSVQRTPICFRHNKRVIELSDFISLSGGYSYLFKNGRAEIINTANLAELLYYDKETDTKRFEGDFVDGDFLSIDNISPIYIK